MQIKSLDPIIVRAQDVGKENSLNVGGYTGYQVLVKVETDEGITGWGECCTGSEFGEAAWATKTLIEKGFTPRVIGDNPLEYRKIWNKLYYATEWYGRRGLAIFALSGVDTALLDISGKALGIPICYLMGGCFKKEIRVYASLLFDMQNFEETAKKALPYIKEGYFGVKFGWGQSAETAFGLDPERDEKMIETIRNVIGPDTRLMIDVGRYVNWNLTQAKIMAKRFEKYDVYWLEEPLPQDDINGYAELARSVDIPIAGGEGYQTIYEFHEILAKNALDIIQPDPSKLGGLSEAREVVRLIELYNKNWVPHNWSTAINTAACLQLVTSSQSCDLIEFKKEPNPLVHDILKHPFELHNGKIMLPQKPGLGIEVDEDKVYKYSIDSK
jgi:L-rhamnonate dehydratase